VRDGVVALFFALPRPARDSKVRDTDAPIIRNEHVVGLEVTMHDPVLMRRGQASARGNECGERLTPGARLRVEPFSDGGPLDELHREVCLLSEYPNVVDLHDVGVGELRHRLRLAEHPRLRKSAATLGSNQLECDLAIELGIVGRHDDAHPAAPNGAEHKEATDSLWCIRAGLLRSPPSLAGQCRRAVLRRELASAHLRPLRVVGGPLPLDGL